jgi:hypothetical protein
MGVDAFIRKEALMRGESVVGDCMNCLAAVWRPRAVHTTRLMQIRFHPRGVAAE